MVKIDLTNEIVEKHKVLYHWYISFEAFFRQGSVEFDKDHNPVPEDINPVYQGRNKLKKITSVRKTYGTFMSTETSYFTPFHMKSAVEQLKNMIESSNYKPENKKNYEEKLGSGKWNLFECQVREITPIAVNLAGICSNEEFEQNSEEVKFFIENLNGKQNIN